MFFFFKQKTAYEMRISDWSSDVCSSDLARSFPRRVSRPAARSCHHCFPLGWVCQVHRADPCNRGPERRLAYRPSYLSSTGSIPEERGVPVADTPAQKLLHANRPSPISADYSQKGRFTSLHLPRRFGHSSGL